MKVVRVQDAVHGMMEFEGADALVVRLLDAPEVRRLRGIRQMGLAYYLYPSAEHSRFVHSLGVAYLALRFGLATIRAAELVVPPALRPRRENIRDLAIAGLVHDLGHGPLSHAWEREVIPKDYDHIAWAATLGLSPPPERPAWHELVTQAMLLSESSSLHGILKRIDRDLPERIASVLDKTYYLPYLSNLLSSDADVDRFDFMLRDAMQCGLRQGQFDLDRLLSTVALGERDGSFLIGFDRWKAETAIHQFLLARVALYEVAYYHRTVRSAEAMAGKFLKRLSKEARDLSTKKSLGPQTQLVLRAAAGEPIPLQDLISLDDTSLTTAMLEIRSLKAVDRTLRDLADRLLDRRLLKDCRLPAEVMSGYVGAKTSVRQEVDDEVREAIRRILPSGLDPDFYFHIDEDEKRIFGPPKADAPATEQDVYFVDGSRLVLVRSLDRFKNMVTTYKQYRCFVVDAAKDDVARIFSERFRG
jgi:uncharacterized protein